MVVKREIRHFVAIRAILATTAAGARDETTRERENQAESLELRGAW